MNKRVRLNVYLSPAVAEEIAKEVRFRRGASKSGVVEKALRDRYSRKPEDLMKNLLKGTSSIRKTQAELKRQSQINSTLLAGFIRLWLCYSPPIAEGEKENAERMAVRRFGRFLDLVLNDAELSAQVQGELTSSADEEAL